MIGESTKAGELFDVLGFSLSDDDAGWNVWWPGMKRLTNALGTWPEETYRCFFRMQLALSASQIKKDKISAWMPSPEVLEELDKAWITSALGIVSVLNLGARLYERMGNDDKARQTAEIAIRNKKARGSR